MLHAEDVREQVINLGTMPDKQKIALILSALRRKKAAEDVKYFANYYLAHHLKNKTPEFHNEIYSLLGNRRLAIAAPRGFAKSTIVQVVRGLQLLLTGKGEDILTISASGDLAREWIRKLKIELDTNEKIKQDFGFIYNWGEGISRKWDQDQITIDDQNGKIINQVRAKGRGCQVRGFRPTRIFCDDLEDDELVRSSEQRKKLSHWVKGALLNTLTLDQQLIVIGTLLHPLALLKEMVENKDVFGEWETRIYKAITDGKSIWEEKWPTEKLLHRKSEIGTFAFEAEFMNNPLASEDILFRPEWIKKWPDDWKELPEIQFKIMFLDPASSTKDSADESAMVCLGITRDLDIYEIDSMSGKWGIYNLAERFIAFYEQNEPDTIGIEKVAFQGVLKEVFLEEARKKGYPSMPIKQVTVGAFSDKERKEAKDKWSRAYKVTHFFENGKVFLKNTKIIDQLIVFPTGDADDLLDAVVYSLLMMKRFTKKFNTFSPNKDIKKIKGLDTRDSREVGCEPPPAYNVKKKYDWRTAC